MVVLGSSTNKKKYIVWDIDETLVSVYTFASGYDEAVSIKDVSNEIFKFYLTEDGPDNKIMYWGIIRPHARELLHLLQTNSDYVVGVWSAGEKQYVNEIVKKVFKIPPKFVWTRDQCNRVYIPEICDARDGEIPVKSLLKLWSEYPEMNKTNTLMIDNRHDVCSMNILNHIHVPDFRPSRNNPIINDDVLLKLHRHLMDNKDIHDVRLLSGIKF